MSLANSFNSMLTELTRSNNSLNCYANFETDCSCCFTKANAETIFSSPPLIANDYFDKLPLMNSAFSKVSLSSSNCC